MPEMTFTIRWPDGAVERCYSPSLVIRDHFAPGADYALADFRARARTALTEASDRVQARYGFPCSRAMGQLDRIEAGCARFATTTGARVRVERFDDPAE